MNVNHVIRCMLPAVRGGLTAVHIERRSPLARVMRATPIADIHHAILSMLFAVSRLLAAIGIVGRSPRAAAM